MQLGLLVMLLYINIELVNEQSVGKCKNKKNVALPTKGLYKAKNGQYLSCTFPFCAFSFSIKKS